MSHVILTVGPQGSGKTTFCRDIIKERPDIKLIVRDDIITQVFGHLYLDPYTGEPWYAKYIIWRVIKHSLKSNKIIILDHWNGFPEERINIIKRLRELKVTTIDAWRFITPEDTCTRWFLSKENPPFGEESCRRDYRLYHSFPVKKNQGFDNVREINPTQQILFPYHDLLLSQA